MRTLLAFSVFSLGLFGQTTVFTQHFEGTTVGQTPPGWYLSGYNTTPSGGISDQDCYDGTRCVTLSVPSDSPAGSYGIYYRTFPLTSYAGRKMTFRAAVRTDPGATADLWVRASNSSDETDCRADMSANPISSATWAHFSVDCQTTIHSTTLYFGYATRSGTSWLDDVAILMEGEFQTETPEGPRALTDRGLENLVAFAKLAGYVRYFHPSDQAYLRNWEAFTVEGVRAVESAADSAELATRLQALFDPIAPTVRVFPDGQTPPIPPDLQPAVFDSLSVVQWSHEGLGIGTIGSSLYRSFRKTGALAGSSVPEGFTEPVNFYQASLGAGLTAWVPVSLYWNEQGTIPSRPAPQGYDPVKREATDRGMRLAGVILAWNVFQHFYPYFDVTGTDMPGELRKALRSAAENTGPTDYTVTLKKLVASLKDGHGNVYYTLAPAAPRVPLVWAWAEGQLIVARVMDAQGQEIQPGDRVLSIGGKDVGAAMADQAQLESSATPQYLRWRTVQDLALCNPDTSRMQLEIEPYTARGTRRSLDFACISSTDWSETRPDKVAQLEPGVMYVDLDRVTDSDITAALPQLEAATGIVYDMRGYPRASRQVIFGHLSATPTQGERYLYPTPVLPDQTGMTYSSFAYTFPPLAPTLTARRVFLLDARAISAAETDMNTIEYHRLGEFVGEPTAGTTGSINPFSLFSSFSIYWTGTKVEKPNGDRMHGVGVRPNFPASRTRRGIAEGVDEILQRGVEVVKGPQPGDTPQIAAEEIVNSASQAAGAVAPGEIVTIHAPGLGAHLALGTYDEGGFLSRYLAKTRVLFDDVQAPLASIIGDRVSAIVPYGVGATTTVKVERELRQSNEVTLPVAAAAPGVYTVPGVNYSVIVNQNGLPNTKWTPAHRGETITFFVTGEGRTTPAGRDGVLPDQNNPPAPVGEVQVLFGEVPGTVEFKGVVLAGVMKVTARVPENAPTGNAVPLRLTVGGVANGGDPTVAIRP